MASIEMGGRNPNWFRRQLVGVKNKEGNQYSAGLMPTKLIFEEQDSAQYQVHTKIIEILWNFFNFQDLLDAVAIIGLKVME